MNKVSLAASSIGYMPRKKDRLSSIFNTFNYSLILSGKGHYDFNGTRYQISAPCVITQWPSEKMNYGPTEGTTWEELYIIYPENTIPSLEQRGFIPFQEKVRVPFWSLSSRQFFEIKNQMEQLFYALDNMDERYGVTRIDLILERIVFEYLAQREKPISKEEALVHEGELFVREKGWSLEQLENWFLKNQIDKSKFRRIWNTHSTLPPGKFILSVKISKACRMLVESDLSIKEIARILDFEDELYFSRRFRIESTLSPTQYREIHRLK